MEISHSVSVCFSFRLMSEEGHGESVGAIRSFVFQRSVPDSSCQMGQDGMLNCFSLPSYWPPSLRYYSPITWSLWSSESLLPPIGTHHKSSSFLSFFLSTSKPACHPAPIRAPSIRMIQARSLPAYPHGLFRTALRWETRMLQTLCKIY